MKKPIFVILMLTAAVLTHGQDTLLTSKKGIPILPEQGELAIGIDAVPFLNMFNDKGSSPGFNFVNDIPAISLKYMMSNQTALRMRLMVGFESETDENNMLNTSSQDKSLLVGLGMGYEWRRGSSRVQGFYGLQGNVMYYKTKSSDEAVPDDYEYTSFSFGLEGFLGVEYFIAPKLSLSGQFAWGPSISDTSRKDTGASSTSFDVGANNANGALILAFYF